MSDNNGKYWARRLKKMEEAIQDRSYDYVQNLERQYDAAISELDTQIRAWYQRIAANNGISYAAAQKLLNANELKEFHWTVQEYIKRGKENGISADWSKELENASAKVHISRLESLKLQIRQKAEELSAGTIKATENAARNAFSESYYHTAFEIQKGLGIGWTMQGIDESRFEKVLSRPWTADGKTFKARCWTDKNTLLDVVSKELTRMIATGEAPDRAIEAIEKRFKVSKANAGRLVMTESAFFAIAAQKDCFNDLDVERYVVVGTLDRSTCELCGEMDGKVFPMSAFEPGNTAPPFHPWCRCCTAPYFEDMQGIGERFARDPETGKTYTVPKDMTYKEWKAKQDLKNDVNSFTLRKNSDIMQSSGKIGDQDEDTVITDVYDIPPSEEAIMKELDSFVSSFAYAEEEHSMVISPFGHVTVLSGGASTVKTQLAGADQLRGAIVIHNHPLGRFAGSYDDSFSKEDFIFAAKYGCGKQYVVSGTLKNAFEFLKPITVEELSLLYEKAERLTYARAALGLLDMSDHYLAICRVIPDVTKKVAFYEF